MCIMVRIHDESATSLSMIWSELYHSPVIALLRKWTRSHQSLLALGYPISTNMARNRSLECWTETHRGPIQYVYFRFPFWFPCHGSGTNRATVFLLTSSHFVMMYPYTIPTESRKTIALRFNRLKFLSEGSHFEEFCLCRDTIILARRASQTHFLTLIHSRSCGRDFDLSPVHLINIVCTANKTVEVPDLPARILILAQKGKAALNTYIRACLLGL